MALEGVFTLTVFLLPKLLGRGEINTLHYDKDRQRFCYLVGYWLLFYISVTPKKSLYTDLTLVNVCT